MRARRAWITALAAALTASCAALAQSSNDDPGLERLDGPRPPSGLTVDALDAGVTFELLQAAEAGDAAAAEALLREAYEAALSPSRRAAVFRQAVDAVVPAGDAELVFTWIAWGFEELAEAPLDEQQFARGHAIDTAIALERIDAARAYGRRYGELEAGWRDDPGALRVVHPETGLVCPDFIDEVFIRRSVTVIAPIDAFSPAEMRCVYRALDPAAPPWRIVLTARRSWIERDTAAEALIDPELGVDAAHALGVGGGPAFRVVRQERATLARVAPRPADPARIVAAEYQRSRQDAPIVRTGAVARSGDALVFADVLATNAPWPPEDQRQIAVRALTAALGR